MKIYLRIILLLLLPFSSLAQQNPTDSLRKIFFNSKDDSVTFKAATHLYDFYEETNRDSAFFYADQCVQISRRNNKKLNESFFLNRKAYQQLNTGRYAASLNNLLEAFDLCENTANNKLYWDVGTFTAERDKRLYALACAHHIYGILMLQTLNQDQEIRHLKEAKKIAVEINSSARSLLASLNLGRIYFLRGNLDSALYYEHEAASIAKNTGWQKYLSSILYYTASINMQKGNTDSALKYLYEGIQSGVAQNNLDGLSRCHHVLAGYYISRGNRDSSLYYAIKSLQLIKQLGDIAQIEYHMGDAYKEVYEAYQLNGQFDSAYKYLALTQQANDSFSQRRIKNLAEFQALTLNQQQRLQNIEKQKLAYQNKVRTYFLLGGIGVFLLLALIFYRNNRQKHKAKIKIEQAYDDLKSTQQQLIQSEKMASLGELTAGIAHEIQNPLNFVNNFSDINKELLTEMDDEIGKGNLVEVRSIAKDVIDNEEKINHHGKRADGIVKSMLQHSRSNSGKKEPTDINKLTEEYLKLAYHGLRAKDGSFNATIKTDFDHGISPVNIIPQDMGRVILNLITNAFYAVSEKKKQMGN